MRFTKMHGLGNDYVFVDCFREHVPQPERLARIVSDRHRGIGSDGLILIKPSEIADFEMVMYNADGSRGEMCGNGIRCVAKYVYEKNLTAKTSFTVETLAGIRQLELLLNKGEVTRVRVNMGGPVWEAVKIPVVASTCDVINREIQIENRKYNITCLSMGNPHCVIFLKEEIEKVPLERIGSFLERHEQFPNGVNVEIANVLSEKTLQMRVWERGSKETQACGTGACAVAAAAMINGYTKDKVQVQLPGGSLEIEWDRKENQIYMTGPAVRVYEGDFIWP